jgi:hypothetical protein
MESDIFPASLVLRHYAVVFKVKVCWSAGKALESEESKSLGNGIFTLRADQRI